MKNFISIFIFISLMSFYSVSIACTVIVAGKKATVDGSLIVSHTDAGPDCRVHVMPGQFFTKGAQTPIYWGMTELGRPLGDYGDTLGFMPQVEQTFSYFQSAYPQMNEYQLTIGESTTSMREELKLDLETCKQIMTVEQAQAFALQRCKTAKEALKLITALMEKYGFRPSCAGESESLVLADTKEAWVLEIFAVGNTWNPESGKPGAIWAAQRVPDDHVLIIPNWSIIKQIDLKDTENFRASANYMLEAIDRGWYDPESGQDFVWQDVYAPVAREWATSRFWLFYATQAPNLKDWPDRFTTDPFKGDDQYTQYVEPLSLYPFSVKPEKKMSVQDVMAFQRSTFTGTEYDKENAPGWYYPDKDGKLVKSEHATPFPTEGMRKILKINRRRNVARARGEYGMIAQLRDWLPNEVGGIYWFYVDNAFTSPYVPMYAGITDVADCYKHYDKEQFSENSMRWVVDFVDNLLYLRWQDAVKDLHAARDPMEQRFFDEQKDVDEKFSALYKKNPKKAKAYLTELTIKRQNEALKLFQDLRIELITKYTNNKQGI
ncbi:MAG: C69 family dipeptidase [Bacteroidales bacterium]|nr:C69 family dipeptidase [Bacteroidales bacterium]MCF8404301.1 C69 family dipeptidase [Bacteroidales bacterium]